MVGTACERRLTTEQALPAPADEINLSAISRLGEISLKSLPYLPCLENQPTPTNPQYSPSDICPPLIFTAQPSLSAYVGYSSCSNAIQPNKLKTPFTFCNACDRVFRRARAKVITRQRVKNIIMFSD